MAMTFPRIAIFAFRVTLAMNWLQVFGNAEASRMGQGVRPQLHARAMPSEKRRDSVAAYGAGMRVIAAFFWPVHS